jgi:hypothetical protein
VYICGEQIERFILLPRFYRAGLMLARQKSGYFSRACVKNVEVIYALELNEFLKEHRKVEEQ